MLALALLQTGLPTVLALWLVLGRPPTVGDLVLRIAAAAAITAGVWLAGIWLALPILTPRLLAVAVLLAGVVAILRFRPAQRAAKRRQFWLGRTLALGLAAVGLWAVVPALLGRQAGPGSVDLRFPFGDGRYIVANGGSTARINAHFMTLRPAYRRWLGQSYGVDFIRVDELGFRTRSRQPGHTPRDPRTYLTYGTPVLAPCDGTVESSVASYPDMPVPVRDRQHLEGNHVRLGCGNHVVLLAHFRQGGTLVRKGERVTAGQRIGFAGNSGNSDEPHLHVHVQRPGTNEAPLSGQPLPVTFDGRFLARNQVIDGRLAFRR